MTTLERLTGGIITPSMVVSVWRRGAWLGSWLFDGAVAALVAALAFIDYGLPWPIKICGLLMALLLIWRRHLPVAVFAGVCLLAPAHLFLNSYVRMFDVAVLIAMYSVVLYRPGIRWGLAAGAVAGMGSLVAAIMEDQRSDNFWAVLSVVGAVTVAAWVTAHGVRTRRLYVETLEERAATLERERDHLALLAVADERAAIAREVHDVVAHSLSVIIVQADAAGYTLDGPREPTRQALAAIASTGREALDDMGRVVQLLRRNLPSMSPSSPAQPVGGGPPNRSGPPHEADPGNATRRDNDTTVRSGRAGEGADPGDTASRDKARFAGALPDIDDPGRRRVGLAELDVLIERSGLRVSRETVGSPAGLSPALELTIYRIVQESLTNALRHAGTDAAANLRLTFTPRTVCIEVRDNGGGRPSTPVEDQAAAATGGTAPVPPDIGVVPHRSAPHEPGSASPGPDPDEPVSDSCRHVPEQPVSDSRRPAPEDPVSDSHRPDLDEPASASRRPTPERPDSASPRPTPERPESASRRLAPDDPAPASHRSGWHGPVTHDPVPALRGTVLRGTGPVGSRHGSGVVQHGSGMDQHGSGAGRPGHGLLGMRERVAMHGGELVVGPHDDGGWRVTATIPRTSGGLG